ncbi:MAG: hypothetical protein ACK5LZ_03050 [Anaerorhabdus sp.]
MSKLFQGGTMYYSGRFQQKDFIVDDTGVVVVAEFIDLDDFEEVIDCTGIHVFPGFISIDQKLIDYTKESIEERSKFAIQSGVTQVMSRFKDTQTQNLSELNQIKKALENYGKSEMYPMIELDNDAQGTQEFTEDYFLFSINQESVKAILDEIQKRDGVAITRLEDENKLNELVDKMKKNNAAVHLQGVKSEKAINMIQKAQKEGLYISAEVDVEEILWGNERESLICGIETGVIGAISSNWNNHVQDIFGLLYTELVKEKKITLEKLVHLLSASPAEILGIRAGEIENLEKSNLVFFDLVARRQIKDVEDEKLHGKWVMGLCCMSIVDGLIHYRNGI